jgi:formylglycine-generating enzyme required for sulfatase activity
VAQARIDGTRGAGRRKAALTIALASLLAIGAAAIGLVRANAERTTRLQHFDQNEVELRINAPTDTTLTLRRAGATLDGATEVPLGDGATWLPRGNYFLEAGRAEGSLLYPVQLPGLARGPDAGGALAVTVRGPAPSVQAPAEASSSGFALVPAGQFAMGDPRNPNECHYVYVAVFFAAVFEVTNGEFRRFLNDPNGYADRANWTEEGWQWQQAGRSQATARLTPDDPDHPRFGQDDMPVVLVTWYEANAYARWLTRKHGQGKWLFRMATEAEWEKAARGPDGFDYGLGTTLSEGESPLYNWRKNPGAEVTLVGLADTRARYRANRFGIHHASGNAAEWTQSLSRPYGRERPYRDDDRNLDGTRGLRTTRGGSWYSATTSRLHLAYREEFQPELSSNDLGFRLVALPLPGAAR